MKIDENMSYTLFWLAEETIYHTRTFVAVAVSTVVLRVLELQATRSPDNKHILEPTDGTKEFPRLIESK